jgi:hypothetical protein
MQGAYEVRRAVHTRTDASVMRSCQLAVPILAARTEEEEETYLPA